MSQKMSSEVDDLGVSVNEFTPENGNGADVYGTGLKNEVGEYNCFLNVIIQSLWHLRRFRDEFLARSTSEHVHVGDPCVTCALYDIFTALSMASTDMRREAVAPTSLRIALSNLYPDSNFFQEVMCAESSFEELLDFVEMNHQLACDPEAGGCGNLNYIHHILSSPPHVFTIGDCKKNVELSLSYYKVVDYARILKITCGLYLAVLGWQNTCESVEDITATLASLAKEIDISVLYRGLDPKNRHCLVSVTFEDLKWTSSCNVNSLNILRVLSIKLRTQKHRVNWVFSSSIGQPLNRGIGGSEYASDSLYLFNGGKATFYRWRRESRARRSWRNPRVVKYGRRSHGYRMRIRRMPYGGGTVSVGVREEMESYSGLIHDRAVAPYLMCQGGTLGTSSKASQVICQATLACNDGMALWDDTWRVALMEAPPSRILLLLVITKCCPCSDVNLTINLALVSSSSRLHLRETSFMTDEVNQLPSYPPEESPPRDEPSDHGGNPEIDTRTPFENEFNIMTQGDLDRLRESCSFPSGIQARLFEDDETILSTRPGEVAFYEAAFHAGLRFPIHPTVRRILHFYNICPAQLVPNAWRSVVCTLVVWRYYRRALSLNEFRGGRGSSSSSQETTESSPRAYLGRKEFRGSRDHGAPQVPVVLGSKTFKKCFALGSERMVSSGGDNAEDELVGGAAVVAGDKGESHHSQDERPRNDHSRDDSVEYLGTDRSVRAQARTLNRRPGQIHSSPSLDQMKISLKKLDQMGEGSKGSSPSAKSTPTAKGIVVGDKCPRDEVPDISPSKKGSKGKGAIPPPEAKKAAKSTTTSSVAASRRTPIVAPGEGTSASPDGVLGPQASMLENPVVAEKLLEGVIPPVDKEEVEKLDLGRAILRLFRGVGEVLVLASSLARTGPSNWRGYWLSSAIEKRRPLKSLKAKTEALARLEGEMANLKKNEAVAKKRAIVEFKVSNDFQEAVELTTFNHDHERWVMYDDKTVKVIGGWDDVLNMCERGHLQPQVLLFEAVN
ncbi:ubiquitin carboxyl-terminal hydrolase-related protein [Actinidia rufa]|uniref:Ubiquitin carboxyl-terminal hydrolase-related protein n=1 Tax=Actinidia rufa TaxID=165716 RepID=A0A7J0H425_9ERIC|nr:ubiquitin carboxyl-terminal hydrolase-related protein [Actinidia rufa]